MKNLIVTSVIILIIILSFTAFAKAEEFAVSCIMPAIPGVNAPLSGGTSPMIQEETVLKTQPSPAAKSPISYSEQNNSPEGTNSQIQQEDSNEDVVLAKNSSPAVVQTLYSR